MLIDIEAVYQAYPRKIGRRKALLEIERAITRLMSKEEGPMSRGDAVTGLVMACVAFSKSPASRPNGLFSGYCPPYPSTWFHQSRYMDDAKEWFNVSKPESTAATRQRETSDNLTRAFAERTLEELSGNSVGIFRECADRRRRADLARPTQPLLGWGD